MHQVSYRSGRNIDINVIVFNNNIYGMTGGQFSPTTLKNIRTSTAVNGMLQKQFNIYRLLENAGVTYVARGNVMHCKNSK